MMSPESPKLQYTDRVRATDIYMGVQSVCAANMLPRGTFGSGFRSGWVVNQCSVETMRGGIGRMTIEWEAGGTSATQPLPVGNGKLMPQELYPKIERNQIFSGMDMMTLHIVYNAHYLATTDTGMTIGGPPLITASIATGSLLTNKYYDASTSLKDPSVQLPLALQLYNHLAAGAETYYLAAWRYTYEEYSYSVPTISPGGIIGTPGGPYAGNLPAGMAWIRLADDLEPAGVNGSMNKLTVTWLGGPLGYWPTDIYASYS